MIFESDLQRRNAGVLDAGEVGHITVQGREIADGKLVDCASPVEQSVHVIYEDGTIELFIMSAAGRRQHEVRLIPLQSPYESTTNTVAGDIFVLDNTGKGEVGVPVLEAPPGVKMTFEGWATIERQTEHRLRPTRQIGSYVLDLSEYQGEFPLEVDFISESGVTNTFVVTQPAFDS